MFQNIAHVLRQQNVSVTFGGGGGEPGLYVALYLSYFDQNMMLNYFENLKIRFVDFLV